MGYEYEITYKNGKENIVADALSCTFDDHVSLSAISMSIPNWLYYVHQGYINESSLPEIIQQLASNLSTIPHYSWYGSSLRYKGRLMVRRAHIFTRLSSMNSMLLQWQGTLGSSKRMSGHDVTSFGRE